jgi:hypothetical protein
MINQDVETSIKSLNDQAQGDASEQDIQRAIVDVQSRVMEYQKGLGAPAAPKSIQYDVGASFNSFESRWKYQLLKVLTAGNGVSMKQGKAGDKTVQLTGDPYVIEVTARSYESTREWLRRLTRRNLTEAAKKGEVENNFAWYTSFRHKLIQRLEQRIPSMLPPEAPPEQAAAPEQGKQGTAQTIHGTAEPTPAHLVVEISGQMFDLVLHKQP